jgi:hypothetical protein
MARDRNGSAALSSYPPAHEAEVLSRDEMIALSVDKVLQEMPQATLGQMFDRLRELEPNSALYRESRTLLMKKREEMRTAFLAETDIDPAGVIQRVNGVLDGREDGSRMGTVHRLESTPPETL